MAPPQANDKGLRSEGILPAVGVGAAVYFTLTTVSLGTLGLVGIGAGVGYGVGSWAMDRFREKRCQKKMDQLPAELKEGLRQWQAFLASRHPGNPNPAEAEALFAEFAQFQPFYAQQVQQFVHAHGGSTAGGAAYMQGGGAPAPQAVPVRVAAEV
mmetsp:Transcript_98493/g.234487  ORF Transcript_98493/g.234487 Transcript_98493/m.234487 type:complete len:155 (-) Transcript_98493:253-717(-)|eukprot:CAMPEP_0181457962 /NCGR_PEP_ID=MMETSP1110-20121109/32058_1 /TAXON_ID=174948 /ORGANISM="Symbiodinium sp., Strain CCMP421" /LENGTH=154 /DNA_ID=CAMNT_0023582423 /DNA_START=61 /DNA_END=525 /DNA_ORIENTATION=+